ncbi:M55 family metallopeptidase [Alkaliphilus peptidifermentans]|uniref:D-amino peptidase n=1 Tax=Alkaliphilus peptidifermentans DSM 18978 TaxID=1120976 RepID=A0A1G5BLZ0_9FIRM|nr:M55 family metallopeptidase [Alkaliphilus peptidifermentans]SCX91163.1 D-amino peptidase [Alkaliphilus peptidifermentans DSM 18978]
MKIFISVDMEGIWGLSAKGHVSKESNEYSRTRSLMLQETNWAIEALFKNGATEVVVNDSHDSMDNIMIEGLDPRASLITGQFKPFSMMEGIDETFDGVMFIGYHSRMGTENGIYNHTYSGKTIEKIIINGKELGEAGINAGVAGYYGVPILVVSGDDKLALQIKEEIGDVEAIVVKKAISRFCAHNIPMNSVKEQYCSIIEKAIKNITQYPVLTYEGEINIEVTYNMEIMAEQATLIPGVIRKNPKTIVISSSDYISLFKLFRGCLILGGSI